MLKTLLAGLRCSEQPPQGYSFLACVLAIAVLHKLIVASQPKKTREQTPERTHGLRSML